MKQPYDLSLALAAQCAGGQAALIPGNVQIHNPNNEAFGKSLDVCYKGPAAQNLIVSQPGLPLTWDSEN